MTTTTTTTSRKQADSVTIPRITWHVHLCFKFVEHVQDDAGFAGFEEWHRQNELPIHKKCNLLLKGIRQRLRERKGVLAQQELVLFPLGMKVVDDASLQTQQGDKQLKL